jgi:DNA-binding response OmpR family regulator
MADNLKHVLIAEDDDLIVQMYQASLSKAAFQIHIVKDGGAAWDALQTFVPNAIILDIMMPRFNGIEILSKIKADSRLSKVPVIIMSSLADDADKKRALDAGANDYWVKNEVNMIEFEEKINKIMQ